MFAGRTYLTPDIGDLERVEALVRRHFGIDEGDIVLVTEEPGREPGLPERMTTILFWTGSEARHRLRVFKPLASVGSSDLPAAWLRAALADEGEADCC